MTVRYDPATSDSKGPTIGAKALRDHWIRTTGLGSLGIYNYRSVRGSSTLSVHGEGRAADLACNANDPAQLATGDRYAAWLIEHSEELQVQYIVWNHKSWKSGRGGRPYSGASAHTDHLHVELNRDGAAVVHPLLLPVEAAGPEPSPPIEEDEVATTFSRPSAYNNIFIDPIGGTVSVEPENVEVFDHKGRLASLVWKTWGLTVAEAEAAGLLELRS